MAKIFRHYIIRFGKMSVREFIFRTVLISSNYDNSDWKVIGGRKVAIVTEAKLCNIFIKQFAVEISSRKYISRKAFKQTWTENVTESEKSL
ncbi:hypothetical protein D918_09757 [Trichuris suis]|nr:hypothetical protein D918_09757 [Trichuris suis]